MKVRWSTIRLTLMTPRVRPSRVGSSSSSDSSSSDGNLSRLSDCRWEINWSQRDFIRAHNLVKKSGKPNFQGCKIPIPTAIRHDRLEEALGPNISPKEKWVVSLLKHGIPINFSSNYGVKIPQINQFSDTILRNLLIGPFNSSPISDLCFSHST